MDEQRELVVYGTPLENELEMGHRKRAKAIEKGTLRRQQPVWQQEVRDTEGRRRFHGAFTGGFSAGYFNTVGSKEGWEPKTFKSSRSSRADMAQSSAIDFMDEDERSEMESKLLGTSQQFDTFGFTAAEMARRGADEESKKRPSAIPGPVPDELIVPAAKSIGIQLLMKMGWRHGRAIGPKHVAASSEVKREGRKAMMALANSKASQDVEALFEEPEEPEAVEVPATTPAFVLNPKTDLYGLGFDPYKHAPEFRERRDVKDRDKVAAKAASGKSSMFRPNAGTMSRGFGIGALEDMGEEDEDIYATGPRPDTMTLDEEEDVQQKRPAPRAAPRLAATSSSVDVLPGFKVASQSTVEAQWFHPPAVPPDYVPQHKFGSSASAPGSESDAPPEVPQPEGNVLVKLIDGLASLVARSGAQLETLNKEKNKDNPMFQFLFGGTGGEYYTRKLWEERLKHGVQIQPPKKETQKLDASERGKLLGEVQLQRAAPPVIPAEDRARLQASLQNTFMKPPTDTKNIAQKPFADDPQKQARYEVFIKMKFTGGLRKMDPSSQKMSEMERAQELLEFENAALGIYSHVAKPATASSDRFTSAGNEQPLAGFDRFTSAGQESGGLFVKQENPVQPRAQEPANIRYPRRTEETWRPAPLLCKRFGLADPFLGRAVPVKAKSKTDSLTLSTSSEALLTAKIKEVFKDEEENDAAEDDAREEEAPSGIERIQEKPVDLFKAIFSDDEDEEPEVAPAAINQPLDAANAALNRLVADDFLESLGKELGLRVPPPMPGPPPPPMPGPLPPPPPAVVGPCPAEERRSRAEASDLNVAPKAVQGTTRKRSRWDDDKNGRSEIERSTRDLESSARDRSRREEANERKNEKRSSDEQRRKKDKRRRDESPEDDKRRKKKERKTRHN